MHKGINIGLLFVMTIIFSSCSISPENNILQSTEPLPRINNTSIISQVSKNSVCDNRKNASLYEELPSIDPLGKIAYTAEGIYLINPEDNIIEKVYPIDTTKYYGRYYNLAWSPDGTMLSVVHYRNQKSGVSPNYSLEIVDFQNRKVCSVVDGRGELSLPAWSPDNRNLTVADWDSNELLNVTLPESEVSIIDNIITKGSKPQWIDNNHVALLKFNEDTIRHLISVDIQTKEIHEILQGKTLFDFLFSPDGIFLAYSNWDEFSMYILNLQTGEINEVDAHVPMEWTRNGKTLLAETEGASTRIITIDKIITVENPFLGGRITQQCFSSDESMIVFVREGSRSTTSLMLINLASDEQNILLTPYCCSGDPVWNPKPGRKS
jgi:dipeptidyl aminopeptidase/acylaminoacyl peptidase